MFQVKTARSGDGQSLTYYVTGQVFFASSNSLVDAIDYQDVPPAVTIDVSGAHFWDVTAIGALDDIVHKLRRHGARVEVAGLNEASASMVDRFAKHHLPKAARKGGA
jgi:SulP family sulfate permease